MSSNHSHGISMPRASGPCHPCCCSAAWSDTSWCQCLERRNLSPHLQIEKGCTTPSFSSWPSARRCLSAAGAELVCPVWQTLAISFSFFRETLGGHTSVCLTGMASWPVLQCGAFVCFSSIKMLSCVLGKCLWIRSLPSKPALFGSPDLSTMFQKSSFYYSKPCGAVVLISIQFLKGAQEMLSFSILVHG